MKKFAAAFYALFFLALQAQAQFGIKAGISSSNLDRETVQANGVSVALKEAGYGYHFGVFARANVSDQWYVQPEVLFNSNTVDFEVDDFSEGLADRMLSESYQNLDIPLMVGRKLGPLRFEAGPVGHLYIASQSDLEEIGGYEKKFNNFNLGFQAGAGLEIWKILLNLRYEGNFSRFGEHMSIGGQDIKFSQNPSRWVMSVGYKF